MIRIAILAALLATSANAQSPCVVVTSQLIKQRNGETPQVGGFFLSGAAFFVFANTETGTWTAVVETPDGKLCAVASGYSFAQMPKGDPA